MLLYNFVSCLDTYMHINMFFAIEYSRYLASESALLSRGIMRDEERGQYVEFHFTPINYYLITKRFALCRRVCNRSRPDREFVSSEYLYFLCTKENQWNVCIVLHFIPSDEARSGSNEQVDRTWHERGAGPGQHISRGRRSGAVSNNSSPFLAGIGHVSTLIIVL